MKTRSEAEKKYSEYELLKFAEERKYLMRNHPLRHIMWETTTRCNAGCAHCNCSCEKHNKVEEVDIKYMYKVLDDVNKAYGAQNVFFVTTGGEPLLRKGIFDVCKYATSLGYEWGLTTNGSLLTKTMVQRCKDAGLKSLNVSIDGLKETHESFRKLPGFWEKIWAGIDMMREEPAIPIVQITTVATKRNIHELEDLYNFLVSKGIKYWRILTVDENGRARENKDILLESEDYEYIFDFIDRHKKDGKLEDLTYGCSNFLGLNLEQRVRGGSFLCTAGILSSAILSNGDLFVCPNVTRKPELMQGNITKDNFVDVWENRYNFFRDENKMANPKCLACKDWKFCIGGSLHTFNFEERCQDFCMKERLKTFE